MKNKIKKGEVKYNEHELELVNTFNYLRGYITYDFLTHCKGDPIEEAIYAVDRIKAELDHMYKIRVKQGHSGKTRTRKAKKACNAMLTKNGEERLYT